MTFLIINNSFIFSASFHFYLFAYLEFLLDFITVLDLEKRTNLYQINYS